jgi:hypothetical protein
MSMRYLGESLAILKAIDPPMLTLMSLANPWMPRIARPVDVPFGRGISRLAVFGDDLVGRIGARGWRLAARAARCRVRMPERRPLPQLPQRTRWRRADFRVQPWSGIID